MTTKKSDSHPTRHKHKSATLDLRGMDGNKALYHKMLIEFCEERGVFTAEYGFRGTVGGQRGEVDWLKGKCQRDTDDHVGDIDVVGERRYNKKRTDPYLISLFSKDDMLKIDNGDIDRGPLDYAVGVILVYRMDQMMKDAGDLRVASEFQWRFRAPDSRYQALALEIKLKEDEQTLDKQRLKTRKF